MYLDEFCREGVDQIEWDAISQMDYNWDRGVGGSKPKTEGEKDTRAGAFL